MKELFQQRKQPERKSKYFNPRIPKAMISLDNAMELDITELFLIIKATSLVDKNNIIVDDDGDYIRDRAMLSSILNVGLTNPHLSSLIGKGGIKKIKCNAVGKVYAVNPYIICRNQSIPRDIYTAFADSKYRYIYGDMRYEEVLI